jgi:hypothetical protein
MPRLLFQGTTGQDVRNLQKLLNFHLPLQRSPFQPQLLTAAKYTGPNAAANSRLLREALDKPRVPLETTTGIFGPKTHVRVLEFQMLNRLDVDGVVGPQTLDPLLDFRQVDVSGTFQPTEQNPAKQSTVKPRKPFLPIEAASPAKAKDPPVSQTNPGTVTTQVQVQAGSQVSANPWFVSPLVLTGQFNILAQNDGRPDFMISLGGQLAWNLGNEAGHWTAQGFVQMGPNGLLKVANGHLDLLNPFVQVMLQKNDGQVPTAGLALGNQVNVGLDDKGRWNLFLNTQVAVGVALDNGLCQAPSFQALGGISLTFELGKSSN